MKCTVLLVITLQLLHLDTFGQKSEKEYKPFSLLIIIPDSISLHESLRILADSVEAEYRESYYSSLKDMELAMWWANGEGKDSVSMEAKEELRLKIERAREVEMDVQNTTCFQLIPLYTCAELSDLFNAEGNPDFSFDYILRGELFSYDLAKISDYYAVDYILTYSQITTPFQNGKPVLKIDMYLFEKKKSKIIYEKTSYGYTGVYKNNYGILRECKNDLTCLLESGVIASAFDLFIFLEKKQK